MLSSRAAQLRSLHIYSTRVTDHLRDRDSLFMRIDAGSQDWPFLP